jgi:hypothetical protein
MPVKKIFYNKDSQLEAYVNADAKLFISVGTRDQDEPYYSGFITLDRSDLDELIDLLMNLKDEVFDESELESNEQASEATA